MRYLVLAMVGTGVMLAATAAPAADSAQPPLSTRRQVMDCMSKWMSINKALSYNDANKQCKSWVKTQKMDSAANLAPKPSLERLPGT